MGTANLIILIFLGRLKSLKRQTDISARVDTHYYTEITTEGSATIPNHVDGFSNQENQVEILESRIIISTLILGYLVFFRTL